MMQKKIRYITTLFLFLILAIPAWAQDSTATKQKIRYDKSDIQPSGIIKNDLKSYQNDEAFNYQEYIAPDNWWTRFNNWLSELWQSFIQWILNGREAKGILKFIIEALPYLLVLGVLVFLVWLFIKVDITGSPLQGRTPGQVILNDEQEIIENRDIQALIDKALAEANYRLAVRYYYLLVLQQLSRKRIIDWQAQKTNNEYVYEIKEGVLRAQFGKVTRIYDFIWYGSFVVDGDAFAKAQREFQKIEGLT